MLLYYREAQRAARRRQAFFIEGIAIALSSKRLGDVVRELRSDGP